MPPNSECSQKKIAASTWPHQRYISVLWILDVNADVPVCVNCGRTPLLAEDNEQCEELPHRKLSLPHADRVSAQCTRRLPCSTS